MDHRTTESSLAELVEDPLIGLLMKSDGVDRRSIEAFVRARRTQRQVPRGHAVPELLIAAGGIAFAVLIAVSLYRELQVLPGGPR
jgi:hypothetical protein